MLELNSRSLRSELPQSLGPKAGLEAKQPRIMQATTNLVGCCNGSMLSLAPLATAERPYTSKTLALQHEMTCSSAVSDQCLDSGTNFPSWGHCSMRARGGLHDDLKQIWRPQGTVLGASEHVAQEPTGRQKRFRLRNEKRPAGRWSDTNASTSEYSYPSTMMASSRLSKPRMVWVS